MEEKLNRVAKMIVELFKDPEQKTFIDETVTEIRGTLDSLEEDVLASLQAHNSRSIFDDLPSNNEAAAIRALTVQRDSLKAEVERNRLHLALALAQLQRERNYS